MGYDDNQFVAFRHFDKEHSHVHIMVNRVNFKGKCTKDSHEKDKNVKVCKELGIPVAIVHEQARDIVVR